MYYLSLARSHSFETKNCWIYQTKMFICGFYFGALLDKYKSFKTNSNLKNKNRYDYNKNDS